MAEHRTRRAQWRRAALLAVAVLLAAPAPALAASTAHVPAVVGDILGIGGLVGGVFGSIGHAVLGAFTWTFGLAANFILTTVGALVRLLIPSSWASKGLQIMEWIVAVPDYAGKVSTPGGGHLYGFAGINALRGLFMWLGVAVAPLTLTYATGRALIGDGDPVAIPLLRVLGAAVLIVSYPYWWQQIAALADQVTHAILTLPPVSRGLTELMRYAVDGVALGGWQLIDLALMAATALALLGLIFFKVALILLGALLYATGPLSIGLVATDSGHALARAWASAVAMLFAVGVAWAALFAVGALLIGDASTAGPLIAGNSSVGGLLGGLLLAGAGLASLWLCLKAGREAGSLLRVQLAGALALTRRPTGAARGPATAGRAATSGVSLRDYGTRLARAAAAAGGELALASPAGAAVARGAGQLGRRGLAGTALAGARTGAARVVPHAAQQIGGSRAGAVAVKMARAGVASWQTGTAASPASRTAAAAVTTATASAVAAAAGEQPTRSSRQRPSSAAASGQAPTQPDAAARAGGRAGRSQTPPPGAPVATSAPGCPAPPVTRSAPASSQAPRQGGAPGARVNGTPSSGAPSSPRGPAPKAPRPVAPPARAGRRIWRRGKR
jgi:hypothetical protein